MTQTKIAGMFIFLLLIPMIQASSIQYSLDNSTWQSATVSTSSGNLSTVVGLTCNTDYYFKLWDGIQYDYKEQRTEACGVSEMEIAISILFFMILAFFAYLGYIFFKQDNFTHYISYVFWYIGLLIPLFVIRMFADSSGVESNVASLLNTVYMIYLIFYFFMLLILVIYFISLVLHWVVFWKMPAWKKREIEDSKMKGGGDSF